MDNTSFDPLAWAAPEGENKQNAANESVNGLNMKSSQVTNNDELAKARVVTERLICMGANIAESYDDYLRLGFALADGLGPDGRELYHQLCAQSAKYHEQDCEKKWQECLQKSNGSITIATFYKMAQTAGVDLSEVGREFSSFPPLPPLRHGSCQQADEWSVSSTQNSQLIDNEIIMNQNYSIGNTSGNASQSHGGVAEVAEMGADNTLNNIFASSTTFSNYIDINDLPPILQEANKTQNTARGRDKVTLSVLNITSSYMYNVSGIYDKRRVYPPSYNFIVSPTGAQKGEVPSCKAITDPIVWEIRDDYEVRFKNYQKEKAHYEALGKKEKENATEPEEPPYRSPVISVNASATAFYQDLAANDGWGMVFETEADVLTQTIKQEYGDYSSGLRKAFHHETIDYSRRKDKEHVYIKEPKLSVMMTCTPGQIPLLLSPQNTENGLANRFTFYLLNKEGGWHNVFEDDEETLYDQLLPLGERFKQLYHDLKAFNGKPLKFTLNEEQKLKFNDFFKPLYDEQIGLHGDELDAFIFRLGLATYRIAMVLTVLRHENLTPRFNPEEPLVCNETDFQTAITIASCLINHTVLVYKHLLPHKTMPIGASGKPMPAQMMAFLNALPQAFTTQEYISIAKSMGIPQRTAERYVGELIADYNAVHRVSTGKYQKA